MKPRYAITTPPPQMQQQTGPLGTLGNYAMKKGLSYGINAALPGGGFAAEAAGEVLPGMLPYFQMGGAVPPGHHRMPNGQIMADSAHYQEGGKAESNWDKMMRQWAELKAATEEAKIGESMGRIGEALQTPQGQMQVQGAMLPYMLQEGGGIHIKKGNEGKFTAKAKAAGMGVQEYARKVLASDSASPATKKQANFARNAAKWHNAGGPIAGMTPGPLGMSDMLAAGKGKDVSKVTYKKKGGEVEDVVEIAYHAPLAAKPKGE